MRCEWSPHPVLLGDAREDRSGLAVAASGVLGWNSGLAPGQKRATWARDGLTRSGRSVSSLHGGQSRVMSASAFVRGPLTAVPSPGAARPLFTCSAPSHPPGLSRVSLLQSGLLGGASASMPSFDPPLATPLVLPCGTSHDL